MSDEEAKDAEFVLVATTACDHDWQRTGEDPATGLPAYVCAKCWSGKNGA